MACTWHMLDLHQPHGLDDRKFPFGQCPPYSLAFGDSPPHSLAFGNDWEADASRGFAGVAFAGDYYRESADVLRGVALGDLYADKLHPSGGAWGEHGKKPCDSVLHEDDVASDFVESTQPRGTPWGGIASTSVLLPRSSATAAEVARAVKGFLSERMAANIVKVSGKKLSLRAVVRIQQYGACHVKAYVWDSPDQDALALELRKRSGDSLAFGQVFRQIASCLSEAFKDVRTMMGDSLPKMSGLPPPPPRLDSRPMSEQDYLLLVELAKDGTTSETKKRAIEALHDSKSDSAAAVTLNSVLAAGVLEALVREPQPQLAASAELLEAEIVARPHCYA